MDTFFMFCDNSRKTLDRNARSALGLFLSLFSSDSLKLDSNLQRTRPLLKNLLIVHFRFGFSNRTVFCRGPAHN